MTTVPPKGRKATKSDCSGCRDDYYNHGGSTIRGDECWSLENAKVIDLILVPLDEVPPHRGKPQKRPHCYRKPGYASYRKESIGKDGFVKGWK